MCISSTLPYWTHNGLILPSNSRVHPNYTLSVSHISTANKGYYECMGTSPQGPFIARAYLLVTREHILARVVAL